tara:strand:+ start:524 stop:703 length:180 start_codon:yes stop_codon:yes gene_type:complete
MQTVKDTNGSLWKVYKVIPGKAHNHTQINIGKKCAESGLTVPDNIAERWLRGEIRVEVR